jgi:glycosyltransferase involved in cell wall biosynthesis
MFSIIIPSYNRANHLPKAIESVLAQSFTDWELIIVDDGSTDNTREIVASYNDPRIKYIYQENAERSAARNNGVRNAKGEWICFLDSDDTFCEDHLASIYEWIQRNNSIPRLICTGLLKDNNGLKTKKPLLTISENMIKEISSKFLIPTQVCVHKSILEKNKFDIRFNLWEDTHLWMRIASNYPIAQIENYTCIQYIHEESTVVQGMKKVNLQDVNKYIAAINDLSMNHSNSFLGKLDDSFYKDYRDSKYRMYLYQARQNKQFLVSCHIWLKGLFNKPSFYLISEFPKIFINKLGFGIHE